MLIRSWKPKVGLVALLLQFSLYSSNHMINFKLSTLNVRGLNGFYKVDQLKSYLRSMNPHVDIFLIQEHKLPDDKQQI